MANNFAIVGVGSSAGGLEPLRELFRDLPADIGMSFVVVSHLDPTQESHLGDLLSDAASLPIVQIKGPITVERNHVYVIAPDQDITIRNGVITPHKPSAPRGHRHPIDSFFRSLAEDAGERAVAIVLSGTGTDGTLGLRFIKAEGGLAIAQCPDTAGFDGMPRSAINTGVVDLVLAPGQMSDRLVGISRATFKESPADAAASAASDKQLSDILALVRKKKSHDFSSYKEATLLRRINRRMGLHRIGRLSSYLERLKRDAQEVDALAADLTINVTGFFRDPDSWRLLDEKVIAPLVAERPDDATIRVWVPACSTGEEAYSIAMLVADRAEAAKKNLSLRIYATDVGHGILASARAGLYPSSIKSDIGAERVARYFDVEDDNYRINKSLRETITFAPQNILQDPPFTRLDLISCRNLLIYLKPEAQRQVLRLFHFALREGGHLFLGSAETVTGETDLFEVVSKSAHLHRRLGPTRHDLVSFPLVGPGDVTRSVEPIVAALGKLPAERAGTLVEQALLTRYAPATALIDRHFRVHYLSGPTGDYLQPASGEPSHNLIAMARGGLEVALRRAVSAAVETHQETTGEARVRRSDKSHLVRLVVTPLRPERHGADRLLVSFFDREVTPNPVPSEVHEMHISEGEVQAELARTREDLRLTIEQMEASSEELRASNEEIRSINEEQRASNEELETSKEELQSLNEELNTVNMQLKAKVTELESRTDDLNNLLNSTDIATLFLDRNLCIRWFTPTMKALLALRPADIGRPVEHFAPRFRGGDLVADARRVLATLQPAEGEADADDGRWYIRRVIPYRSGADRIEGVVVTFSEITERKQIEQEVQSARTYAESIVDTVRDPLLVLTHEFIVQSVNGSFITSFQVARSDTVGKPIFEIGNRQWDIPKFRHLLATILPEKKQVRDFEVEHDFERIGRRIMCVNARQLDHVQLILVSIEDITERKQFEQRREMITHELNHRVKNTLSVVQALARVTMRGKIDGAVIEAFEYRLAALAKSHELLVSNEWRGASLESVARGQLAIYLADGRISLTGPAVILPPEIATPLGLTLHELATNASKYGALKVPDGKVSLNWEIQEADAPRLLKLVWTETGGPKVTKPTTTGSGSNLIEHSIGGAEVTREFTTHGLKCSIIVPLNGSGVG
jgi:two-component system CheB/CheR fusion protein